MSRLHLPPTHSPGSLAPEAAGNGATPRSSYLRRAADGMNTIATGHKKIITTKVQPLDNLAAGDASTFYPWTSYFRTGENTHGVRCMAGLVDTDYVAAVNPRLSLSIYDASDVLVVQKALSYNGRTAPSSAGEVMNRTHLATVDLLGLSPNTEYALVPGVVDGCRPLYLLAHEIAPAHADDSVTGIVDPTKFLAGGPIYDEHVQDLLDAGDKHYRHGGCHYLAWNADFSTTPWVTLTATSYTNLADMSSTTYSAATPGFTLAALHHGHSATSTAGPGVKIAVQATRTVGAGTCDVRLFDGTNSIALTGITSGGAGGWYTGTANIPLSTTKWDVQGKVSSGTFEIKSVCVFAYEA